MTINQITEYLSRSNRELCKIAEKENTNILYLWYDFIKCSIVHGAIINHYCRGGLYKLKGCERRRSLTYGRILKVYKKCNDRSVQHLLENKSHFNTHFHNVVKRRWILSQDSTLDNFKDLCTVTDALIIKPFNGVNGENIYKIDVPHSEEEIISLYDELKTKEVIIEECLKQHPSLSIGGKSVNTIRAFTILDNYGEVHLLKMLLRMGVGDSVVDNYSAGGCVYEVDLQTGKVISPSLTKVGKEVFIHPGTDVCMLGFQVPNWEKVKATLIQAQKQIPQNRFTGWDVAITNDDVEFIEGNHNPGYELLEFFGTKGWYEKIKSFL